MWGLTPYDHQIQLRVNCFRTLIPRPVGRSSSMFGGCPECCGLSNDAPQTVQAEKMELVLHGAVPGLQRYYLGHSNKEVADWTMTYTLETSYIHCRLVHRVWQIAARDYVGNRIKVPAAICLPSCPKNDRPKSPQ